MKKSCAFLFGIVFIFIFTGCSFLSSDAPIRHSESAVESPSSQTDTVLSREEPSDSDTNDASSAEGAPSAEEEKELFLDFWNDARLGYIVNIPCDDDNSPQQYEFWLISSIYLQEKFPDKKEMDANGYACYPTDYYFNFLQAMFGGFLRLQQLSSKIRKRIDSNLRRI